MNRSSLRRTAPLAIAIVVILALIVAACGATATPTAVPVPTKAPAAAAPAAGAAATASFAKDVLPIFQKNCTRCHGGSSPKAGITLDSFQNVTKSGKVTAGNADKSPIYTLTKSGTMPFGGPKLSDADVQKIMDWINAGAKDN